MQGCLAYFWTEKSCLILKVDFSEQKLMGFLIYPEAYREGHHDQDRHQSQVLPISKTKRGQLAGFGRGRVPTYGLRQNSSFLAGTFEPMQRAQLKQSLAFPGGTPHPDGYSCSSTAVYILSSWLRLLLGHWKGECS